MNVERSKRTARIVPLLLGGAIAMLLLVIATGGPDCLQYLDWSRAARQGEITQIPGGVRSPMGLPLTQWSHGPGMFFALPYLSPTRHLVSDGLLAPMRDFRLMGWLAALAMWASLAALLWQTTGRDPSATWFHLAVAFAATHLGYYSFNCSSEILSFGFLASIVLWLWLRRSPDRVDVLGIGTLCACMVLIRPHLAIYLPLVVALLAWNFRSRRSRPRPHEWVGYGLVFGVPIALTLIQILWVNRWMTGSVLGSTYSFGNGEFRSLNLFDPEPLALLLHPWHGLLVYHPFYGLGMVLAIAGVFRSSRSSRLLHLGIATTLLVHLYLQAAWYCWWLGLWSLGNRGFGIAAVLLVPVVAHAMHRARPAERLAIALAMLCCALWSFLLMIQGNTNFMRWSELAGAQAITAAHAATALPWALAMAVAAYLLARRRAPANRLTTVGSAFVLALILDYLAQLLFEAGAGGEQRTWLIAMRVGLAGLAPLVAFVESPTHREAPVRWRRWPRSLATYAVVLLFGCVCLLFARLARDTEDRIAAGGVPGGGPVAAFQVPEVEECYHEYLSVPGFAEKKDALRGFLDEQRSE